MSGPAGGEAGPRVIKAVGAVGAARSRRDLLGGAAGVAGVAVLAGCGGPSLRSMLERDRAAAAADGPLLDHLLAVEQLAIAAYTAAIPLLSPAAAPAATQFLAQELAHAGGLRSLVKDAGRPPHEPLSRYDLGHPRSGEQVLALLHEVESIQVQAYLVALPRLALGPVRMRVAGYFANDAQHLSVVRVLQGQPALPAAVVTGRE